MPPFMEGRKQLPASKVQKGRTIASQRINVERAIGRMKNLSIFKGTIPTSMARLANQIVCVCVLFCPTSSQLLFHHYYLLTRNWNIDMQSFA